MAEDWLAFAGMEEVHTLVVEPTASRSHDAAAVIARAAGDARRLARSLAARLGEAAR